MLNYKIVQSNSDVNVIDFGGKIIQLSSSISIEDYLAAKSKSAASATNVASTNPVEPKTPKFTSADKYQPNK